jgi:predicted nucleic acid-binding protein
LTDYLLDTTVFIDYFRGRQEALTYFNAIFNGEVSGAFSVITEAELWEGLRPGEEQAHEQLLSLLRPVEVDRVIARRGGELRRYFKDQGLGMPDALIAATAETTDAALVTRNQRHFQALQGIIQCEFYL